MPHVQLEIKSAAYIRKKERLHS